jgi:hypothetical protein
VFDSLDEVEERLCTALAHLQESPEVIQSQCNFQWMNTISLMSNQNEGHHAAPGSVPDSAEIMGHIALGLKSPRDSKGFLVLDVMPRRVSVQPRGHFALRALARVTRRYSLATNQRGHRPQ